MLLAVDVGNTHTVIGVFEGETVICHWRVRTDQTNTADELATILHGLFSLKNIKFTDISNMIIASVVPPLTAVLEKMSTRHFGVEPLIVGPGIKTGMPILYENPREVGADRIVNGVAAYEKFRDEDDGPQTRDERGGARAKHRKIPSWADAVDVIVTSNLAGRQKNSGGSRGRGRK